MQGEVFHQKCVYLKVLWLVLLVLNFCFASAQEVCDNGKDDDNDKLIDLQDPDCQCHWKAPVNLLLNASFEELNHCEVQPYSYNNNHDVLKNWEYGVQPYGVDVYISYNYSCPMDVYFLSNVPPQLPLPDGNGIVQIYQNGTNDFNTPEKKVGKTYVSQCLQTPLVKGKSYTLTFFAGNFRQVTNNNYYPRPFTIAVFGNSDCSAVPFGNFNVPNGCPGNYTGWFLLGQTTFFSAGAWVQGKIDLTVPIDVNTIEIGPDCSIRLPVQNSHVDDMTFYLDNLQLAETSEFNFQHIQIKTGNACSGGYVLQAPGMLNTTYQWYKDSIAIPGKTDSLLFISDTSVSSFYNVRIAKAGTCQISEPYFLNRSLLSKINFTSDTVECKGNVLRLGKALPGITYNWNGKTDTIVNLTQGGSYTIIATDSVGCTKTFNTKANFKDCMGCLSLPSAFTPNGDGLNDLLIGLTNCSVDEYRLQIYNRWGQMLFESRTIQKGWDGTFNGKHVPNGVYIYLIRYKNAADKKILITKKGTVAVIR